MGEYANVNGDRVKLGTCEDLYYMRADQMDRVSGGDWPALRSALGVIRFRFPFPDEDGIEPGSFDPYDRGFKLRGYTLPAKLSGDEHGSIQFQHRAGYLVSIPCPEQFGQPGMSVNLPNGLHVARNGFNGEPRIVQQAFRGGVLVTLLRCGACGAIHRLDTLEDARPVLEALRAEALETEWSPVECRRVDRYPVGSDYRRQLETIAARIEAGYATRMPGELVKVGGVS